jgi:NADH:ubiquinone reductase (H+-translocating)
MPTLRRKQRIFVEWTWGMFFATGIPHLRFTGSRALLAAERGAQTTTVQREAAAALPQHAGSPYTDGDRPE